MSTFEYPVDVYALCGGAILLLLGIALAKVSSRRRKLQNELNLQHSLNSTMKTDLDAAHGELEGLRTRFANIVDADDEANKIIAEANLRSVTISSEAQAGLVAQAAKAALLEDEAIARIGEAERQNSELRSEADAVIAEINLLKRKLFMIDFQRKWQFLMSA
jgi:hypothetical protein